MNAPAAITPPYKHTPLFPLGKDSAPYRKLTAADDAKSALCKTCINGRRVAR